MQIDYLTFEPPYQGQIVEERTPAGNFIRYEYEDCYKNDPYVDRNLPTSYKLRAMRAYSAAGLFLGSIEVFYERDVVRFRGSDGREVTHFHAERRLNRFTDKLLHVVKAPGKPEQVYDYINHKNKRGTHYDRPPYLYQVAERGGNYYETDFDSQKRVQTQYAPVGPNGEKVILARYVYENGATAVWDGENNKKIYRYNDEKRVIAVETYEGERLYSVERSVWERTTGNLLLKTVEDERGKVFYRVNFRYDKNHNCVEESVEGALPIYRTYSDDGFNLLLTESDRPGKEIHYAYLPGTNLLTHSFVYLEGKISKRTFHFYDPDLPSVCIKTIIDDATTVDPNEWSEASYRKVIHVVPKKELPCIGFPEEIREYVGDELLTKRRFFYHPSGKVAKEEHHDGDGAYLYTLYYTYDAEERLIAKSDPLGNLTRYRYDQQFNLIEQLGPKPCQRKEWVYDLANRPIQEKEWLDADTILSTTYKYDRLSRLIAKRDPSGFETRYAYDALGRLTCSPKIGPFRNRGSYKVLN